MNFFGLILIAVVRGLENKIEDPEMDSCQSNLSRISDFSGETISPAIIDGYVANMVEFPYAVRIYIYGRSSMGTCTGEAIHQKLVMTAAHCIQRGGHMIVVTGNSDQSDYVAGKNLNKYARYRVSKVFVHPQFDRALLAHDIAIVQLKRKMIHPGLEIVKPSYKRIIQPENATIYGWGGIPNNKNNNKLYGKRLKVQNCTYPGAIKKVFLCLMESGICHGDSGGGLIINGSIYGIASFHDPTGAFLNITRNTYFYTALSEEAPFVKTVLDKNGINYSPRFNSFNLVVFIFTLIL